MLEAAAVQEVLMDRRAVAEEEAATVQ